MKVGVIGAGAVGSACLMSLILRGSARKIVLVNRNRKRAAGVVADMRYGAPLSGKVELHDGEYADLAGANLVMITAGVNEKTGGATDRNDPAGRLRLLETNVAAYKLILPEIQRFAPEAVVVVLTDPPDPLADFVRLFGFKNVLSSGTFLDSLRFRFHLAQRLNVDAASVEAQVVGEHGTSEVLLWSSARVAGTPVFDLIPPGKLDPQRFRQAVEHEVRFANITIIEGNQASQFGIGMVAARIAEMILSDERAVVPIGSYIPEYGVTLSLPSVVGRSGVCEVLKPAMTEEERRLLDKSAETLRKALAQIEARAA
jgi:L-lactate dehydrogenase